MLYHQCKKVVVVSSFLLCYHINSFLYVCMYVLFFSIMGVLSNKCGFQLQYQMIFSIWLLAFSPQMCEHLRRYNIIPVLSDILQESVKEKVTRIILAAFRVSGLFGNILVCSNICVTFSTVLYMQQVEMFFFFIGVLEKVAYLACSYKSINL